jgi:hypothetical protein
MTGKVDHTPSALEEQPQLQETPAIGKLRPKTILRRAGQVFCIAAIMFVVTRSLFAPKSANYICRFPGHAVNGSFRTLTQDAKTRLPSHYTLPSGDRIPSVALGKHTSQSWANVFLSTSLLQALGRPLVVRLERRSR